jgi:hypothetical protein
MAEQATDQFKDMADQAEHVANRAVARGHEAGERVQAVAGTGAWPISRSGSS